MGYPNTSNFVKNTLLHIVFSTLFSVFGYPNETLYLVFDLLLETLFYSKVHVVDFLKKSETSEINHLILS